MKGSRIVYVRDSVEQDWLVRNRQLQRRAGVGIAAHTIALGLIYLSSTPAHALPSFAQQTGKSCSVCHSVSFGPALTAYGRQFKLNGYVWGDAKRVIPPVALMMQGGFTHTSKDQVDQPAPHFATNDNLSVDQASLFYGGRFNQHVGALIQMTYNGESRTTHWDNTDIRFANSTSLGNTSLVYGITVNNNPTVQDLWNSTPAWAYPYIASALAPFPAAKPVLAGRLAQLVLGATAYVMIDDHLYLEAGGYRGISNHWLKNLGIGSNANPHMDGLSPYWRASWQMDFGKQYLSVGGYGLNSKFQSDPSVLLQDRFNDVAFDATYQYTTDTGHGVAADFNVIHEKQTLDASFATGGSASNSNHLKTVSLDVTYAYQQSYAASAGLFSTSGSTDIGLYTPGPVSGSLMGSPDSRGYLIQLEYVPFGKLESLARPWLNVRLGLQYTGYSRFNGAGSNYDGFGRSASDNNTLFGFFWFLF